MHLLFNHFRQKILLAELVISCWIQKIPILYTTLNIQETKVFLCPLVLIDSQNSA